MMANKMLFGKQLTAYDDEDIDELLSKLTEEEIAELNNEVDPDNSLLPPSQRCKDQTAKTPSGPFDREKLIRFLEEKAKNEKDWDQNAAFEKKVRGTVYVPKKEETHLSKQELSDLGFDSEIETEFDEVLRNATEEELVDLAAVLGFTGMLNQVQFHASLENKAQECGGFQGVAKHEKLKLVPDEPPNLTDVEASIRQLEANDPELTELNLNNVKNMSAEQIARLCKAAEGNSKLTALRCAATRMTNAIAEPFVTLLEKNNHLKIVNLESNFLTGELILRLLRAIKRDSSAITHLHLSNQRQRVLGIKIELEVGNLVTENPRLLHLGMDLDTAEARIRVRDHLAANLDRETRQKRRSNSVGRK